MVEGSGSSAHTTQDWLLTGALVVDNTVDRCAAQVIAVNQAKVHRNAVLDQLRTLQTQFAQASASEKPGIKLEIDEVREVLAGGRGCPGRGRGGAGRVPREATAPHTGPTSSTTSSTRIEATPDLH